MKTYYVANIPFDDGLSHHGIKGQKWGIRRYQNEDGSLTSEGKERKPSKLEKSISRGQTLMDKGRTRFGAVGRGVGRQILIAGATTVATLLPAIGGAYIAGLGASYAAVAAISYGGAFVARVLGVGATIGNVAKTGHQVVDISRANASGYARDVSRQMKNR